MNKVRLNITLPEDIADMLKNVKNKSAYIAEAIREKNRLEEKEKMKAILKSAYRETKSEDYEINKDWESTVGDGIE